MSLFNLNITPEQAVYEQASKMIAHNQFFGDVIDTVKSSDRTYPIATYKILLNALPVGMGTHVVRAYTGGYLLQVVNDATSSSLELLHFNLVVLRFDLNGIKDGALYPDDVVDVSTVEREISFIREPLRELQLLGLVRGRNRRWTIVSKHHRKDIICYDDGASMLPVHTNCTAIQVAIDSMLTTADAPDIKDVVNTIVRHRNYRSRLAIPSLRGIVIDNTSGIIHETSKLRLTVRRIGLLEAFTIHDKEANKDIFYYRTEMTGDKGDAMMRIDKELFLGNADNLLGCLSRLVLFGILQRRESTFFVKTPRKGNDTLIKLITL